MSFTRGRAKGSYSDIREKVAQYMREERMGCHLVDDEDEMTPDEQALFFHVCSEFHGPKGREGVMIELEKQYGMKFDAKSVLSRLEQFYKQAQEGYVVVMYPDGLFGLQRDMDKLRRRSDV